MQRWSLRGPESPNRLVQKQTVRRLHFYFYFMSVNLFPKKEDSRAAILVNFVDFTPADFSLKQKQYFHSPYFLAVTMWCWLSLRQMLYSMNPDQPCLTLCNKHSNYVCIGNFQKMPDLVMETMAFYCILYKHSIYLMGRSL